MKLLLKLYAIHIVYLYMYSILCGFMILILKLFFDDYPPDLDMSLIKDAISPYWFIMTILYLSMYSLGTYWMIPLLYFFKKTNKYLVWILGVDAMMAIVFGMMFVTYSGHDFKLSYILRDAAIVLFMLVWVYYKYKHIKRILANG